MSAHQHQHVRLRPLRAVGFVVSVGTTLGAAVLAVGLLPTPSVAIADSATRVVADGVADWAPLTSLLSAAQRTVPSGPVVDPLDGASARPDQPPGDPPALDPAAPAGTGSGRRVVLDLSAQRVWLVREHGSVLATYLVSGSVTDNLAPGHYDVYSRSQRATSYDYAATMRWMVRFTEGEQAAIGFHSIPRDSATHEPVQTWAQLGTPQSHGCVRQRPRDAETLWRFAPLGTPVVVTA